VLIGCVLDAYWMLIAWYMQFDVGHKQRPILDTHKAPFFRTPISTRIRQHDV